MAVFKGGSHMKKLLVTGFITILLAFVLISCGKGNNQTIATPGIGDTTPAPTVTPSATETPSPSPVPEISSAVDFLNLDSVILKDTTGRRITKSPETLNPGQLYIGAIPGYEYSRYGFLILDKEQSKKILTAEDLTEITYGQSECLPYMLRWDDVSVLDVHNGRDKAYFYYLEDSTVVIVNDGIRRVDRNKECNKAWITVISKDDEERYASWIPPKGTIVNCSDADVTLYEAYYKYLRDFFVEETDLPQKSGREPTFELYQKDYSEWIKWRTDNPDYYEKWKSLTFPQKKFADHSTGREGYFRAGYYCRWCELFRGSEVEPVDGEQNFTSDLPLMYLQIKQYGIPKEEVLEYVKWLNWSTAFDYVNLTEDDVEVLYSDDQNLVRRTLKSSKVWYYDGELYNALDLMSSVPAYDIAQMFTEDSFAEYCEKVSNTCWEFELNQLAELRDSWNVYEQTVNADAGVLNTASAVRVLEGFMMLYEELKYSPDVLAGELASKYYEFHGNDEYGVFFHESNKSESRIECEMRTVLTKAARAEIGDVINISWDEQFYIDLWNYVPGGLMVSADPRFYNGPIELFDSGYPLSDHIEIVSSDDEHAKVTLTARSRSGSGELSYDVLFTKVGGIWYISGGTLLDLL